MHRGYVKLWRLTLDKPVFQNAEVFKVAAWCLLKASHKNRRQIVGKKVVDLQPGQFITGRGIAAIELASTPWKYRSCVQSLVNYGFITVKSTNKFSIISIVNWGFYQPDEEKNRQQTTNKPPTNHQQTTTNKNIKNIKNIYPPFIPPTGEKLKIKNPWLNQTAWNEFLQHRIDIRHPFKSDLAVTKNLNVLRNKNFEEQQAVVDNTIANNWRGLFPLKQTREKTAYEKKQKELANQAKAYLAICERERQNHEPIQTNCIKRIS